MDTSCGRSRRTRTQTQVACRRRGGSPTTDTSESEADTDEDQDTEVCIRPGWSGISNRRRRIRQRISARDPISRTSYRSRERSRSPMTPSPPSSQIVSPMVSLTRLANLDVPVLSSAGRVSWAPSDWTAGEPLITQTTSVINTQSSVEDLADSDSYPTTTIRIVRTTIPSTEEDDDDDDDENDDDEPPQDEDEADDVMFTQAVEELENAAADLFDNSYDEDDGDTDLADLYEVNLDHDYSEPGEDADDRNWSAGSGAFTPSEDESEPSNTPTCQLQPPLTPHPHPHPHPQPHPSPLSTSNRSVPPLAPQDVPLADTLMELLECPVCYESMQPPIWQCSRGHLVCRDCAPKLRRCPTCRCAAQRTRNCTLEKVSSALRYPCRNRHRGCTVHLPPTHLTQHEERECLFRDANCRVQSCSWRGEPASATAHVRSAHAGLTRMLQLGRPVVMGVSVPTSSGQRVTRVLRLVDSDRVFYVHLQLNSSPNAAQWCSYVQEFGLESVDSPLEYRLDLDEEGAAEKRLVRPDVVNEVVALIIRGSGRKVDGRQDDGRATGAWRDRTYRARVYSSSEVPDEAPGSCRTRCFSYGQIKKGFYISNSGSIKARIVVTLWASSTSTSTSSATPLVRTGRAGGDRATATSAQS